MHEPVERRGAGTALLGFTERPSPPGPTAGVGGRNSTASGGRRSGGGRSSCGMSASGAGGGSYASVAGSVRSSFALERASFEVNRQSLEAFHGACIPAAPPAPLPAGATAAGAAGPAGSFDLHRLVAELGLPPALRDRMARLAVFAPQTPVPASLLCLLWGCSEVEVASTLSVMAAKGLLNVAKLPDGRVWCLPHQEQLAVLQVGGRGVGERAAARAAAWISFTFGVCQPTPALGTACSRHRGSCHTLPRRSAPQAACAGSLLGFHASLLDAYTRSGQVPLAEVGDDGYFIQVRPLAGAPALCFLQWPVPPC